MTFRNGGHGTDSEDVRYQGKPSQGPQAGPWITGTMIWQRALDVLLALTSLIPDGLTRLCGLHHIHVVHSSIWLGPKSCVQSAAVRLAGLASLDLRDLDPADFMKQDQLRSAGLGRWEREVQVLSFMVFVSSSLCLHFLPSFDK